MLASTAAALLFLAADASRPIVLDGRFDDWVGRPPAAIDPADAGKKGVDLGMISVVDEPAALHLFIELGRIVNLQKLDGRLVLVIDQDGDATTGDTQHGLPGADFIVVFTPPNPKDPAKAGQGVGVRRFVDGAWQELSPYVQRVAFAPTSAARNAEIRIDRDERTLSGDSARFRFVAYDLAGKTHDETEIVTVKLGSKPGQSPPVEASTDPFARPSGTALRVVSWNVERGAPFTNPERFARVLRAVQPDVILFSELTDKQSAAMVKAWLETNLAGSTSATPASGGGAGSGAAPGGPWNVIFGDGGGNLRTAVATRRALSPVPGLERLLWRDDSGEPRDVRFASGLIEVDGRSVLACAVHLKCCGSAGSDEELTRLEETQAIRAGLRISALAPGAAGKRPDGLVIGGDFNLVGAFEPLELMVEGLDVDGSNLAVAEVSQLDARTNATWADDKQPFTPGRLDYVVFADSALTQLGGFVIDTRDLAPKWLSAHGLEASDTDEASDHLPVVVDLGWK